LVGATGDSTTGAGADMVVTGSDSGGDCTTGYCTTGSGSGVVVTATILAANGGNSGVLTASVRSYLVGKFSLN